jgi:nicotinamide-nucleotide amidase
VFFPGVPLEVKAITESFLLDHLKNLIGFNRVILSRTLKVFGIWESEIQERLGSFLPQSRTVSLAFYPQHPEVSLKITGKGSDSGQVQKEMDTYQQVIYDKIGDYIYSDRGETLEEVVGNLLKEKGASLAVAESCTGGLITHRLTNIPGSSEYLERSFVVYSNRAKEELLKVPPEVLKKSGAVSEPAARFMAEGARQVSGTTLGLAVTGIAGPAGASPEKPVGTVFTGVSSDEQTKVFRHLFHGSRQGIKLMSSQMALSLLRNFILEKSAGHFQSG